MVKAQVATGSLENDLGNAYLTSQSLSFPLYKRGLLITHTVLLSWGWQRSK